MAEKFIELKNGEFAENEALQASAGVGDAGKIPALNSEGAIDQSMLPTGIGPDNQLMPASEDLSATDLVNVWNDGGTMKARKADASNSYKATGFVKASVLSGQNALVFFEGTNGVAGLTPGADIYLSGTAGEATETPVTTSASISQRVGTGLTGGMSFEPARAVTLA